MDNLFCRGKCVKRAGKSGCFAGIGFNPGRNRAAKAGPRLTRLMRQFTDSVYDLPDVSQHPEMTRTLDRDVGALRQ